jgi:hypothetical protein
MHALHNSVDLEMLLISTTLLSFVFTYLCDLCVLPLILLWCQMCVYLYFLYLFHELTFSLSCNKLLVSCDSFRFKVYFDFCKYIHMYRVSLSFPLLSTYLNPYSKNKYLMHGPYLDLSKTFIHLLYVFW